jgi:hypothetical protein
MESPYFINVAIRSLDNDLAELVKERKITTMEAISVQHLRLMRGRHLPVVETPVEGWSADGKTWLPGEPGTFTPQNDKTDRK